MVQIIVENTCCKITGIEEPGLVKELDRRMSYQVQGFQFMNISNRWDGRYRLLRGPTFPIGLLSAAEQILYKNNVKYEIIDTRPTLGYGPPLTISPSSGFETRDYQQKIVQEAWKKGSGIIQAPTGAGKSGVIAFMVGRFNIRTVIYVVSVDLLYQMKATIEKIYPEIQVGVVGDGKCDIQDVTVATIWSAGLAFNKKLDTSLAEDMKIAEKEPFKKALIRDMVRDAELLILDEAQFAGGDLFQLLSQESLKARHRFLLSGTPWRENNDSILLEAVAGEKIINLNATDLINWGYLVKPNIVFKDVSIKRGVGKSYKEVYSNYIVHNEERNNYALQACKNFVAGGKRVLMLVRNLEHGRLLQKRVSQEVEDCMFLDGSKSSELRAEGIQNVRNGTSSVLIASTIFDQGIDISSLDALINLGGGKSTGRTLQRVGRVIRTHPGKEQAYVLDFYDQCKYLRQHSQARFKTLLTEKSFSVRRMS